MAPDPLLVGVAASAGVTTFFSPCSAGLLPAYAGYFVGLDGGERESWLRAGAAGAGFGAAAGAGVLATVLFAGVLLASAQAFVPVPRDLTGGVIRGLAVAAGLVVVLLGLLTLAGRGPRFRVEASPPRRRTPLTMAAFGALFAVGSLGCTLPLFLGIATEALTQGPAGALVTFLAYGLGLAGATLVVSAGLGVAADRTEAALRAGARRARPVAGVLLVAGGAYVLYYYLVAVPT